jgi:hypothetical protein
MWVLSHSCDQSKRKSSAFLTAQLMYELRYNMLVEIGTEARLKYYIYQVHIKMKIHCGFKLAGKTQTIQFTYNSTWTSLGLHVFEPLVGQAGLKSIYERDRELKPWFPLLCSSWTMWWPALCARAPTQGTYTSTRRNVRWDHPLAS